MRPTPFTYHHVTCVMVYKMLWRNTLLIKPETPGLTPSLFDKCTYSFFLNVYLFIHIESMILLGSVQRSELEYMLEKKIGLARRLVVVQERKRAQGAAEVQPGPSDRFSVVSFNAKVS